MKLLPRLLLYLFGLLMVLAGVSHFLNPGTFEGFIPDFLPKDAVNYLAGLVEIALGVGVFIPRTQVWAALGLLVLMLAFLPLHVIDLFKENPAIGSHQAAMIRLPMQFVLIAWTWFNYRTAKNDTR